MLQYNHNYTDENEFREHLDFIAAQMEENGGTPDQLLFHLYTDTSDRSVTKTALAIMRAAIPGAHIVGCSTSHNICNGAYASGQIPNLTVVGNVFMDPDTRFEIHQFPLDYDCAQSTAESLCALIEERPWVKAVEMLTTVIDVSMTDFCVEISKIRDDITLFGGGALSSENVNMFAGLPYVYSSEGEADGHAVVFVLYGGSKLHVMSRTIVGWKPLGLPMAITRAKGPILYELDGAPAFERYHHYLSIEDDESFSDNSLLFPLALQHDGRMVVKAPVQVGDDGSLTLTSDLADYHRECRIMYGDPATILNSINEAAQELRAFKPQGIHAFSCAARFMYWGADYISRETLPFESLAPTAGFYTGGEFSRDAGKVLHHNVTLVIVGMREGDGQDQELRDVQVDHAGFSRQMAIVNSLAAFIGVTVSEVGELYAQVDRLARVDGLTGVYNRREIENRIEHAMDKAGKPSVIMIDIDDFKVVNDAYGHKAGDDVLRGLGSLLREVIDEPGLGLSGRWGGEEFMVLLGDASLDEAAALAEKLRAGFAEIDFPASGRHFLSLGVAQALEGETTDLLTQRADKALYAAKHAGKNRVVIA